MIALLIVVIWSSLALSQGINNPCGNTASTTVPGCMIYGTSANTAAQGNDSRITGAAQQTGITTWVPTDASGAGLTFTSVSVNYTRIGNMVYVYGTLTYPITADTNGAVIGGLPVAVANDNYAAVPTIAQNPNGNPGWQIRAVKNTSTFILYNITGAAQLTNAQMTGATIYFMLIYPAA